MDGRCSAQAEQRKKPMAVGPPPAIDGPSFSSYLSSYLSLSHPPCLTTCDDSARFSAQCLSPVLVEKLCAPSSLSESSELDAVLPVIFSKLDLYVSCTLSSGSGSVDIPHVMLDTGASLTFIEETFLDRLGIGRDELQSNLGITTTEGTGNKWSYFSGGLICQVWFKKFQYGVVHMPLREPWHQRSVVSMCKRGRNWQRPCQPELANTMIARSDCLRRKS